MHRTYHAPPKICNLQLAIQPDQDVFRLDIAVHDVFVVQVVERVGHLGNILPSKLSEALHTCFLIAARGARQAHTRQKDGARTRLDRFSSNLPTLLNCLYSSPCSANSSMMKIRFES